MKERPSQTAGPYVHIGCLPNFCDIGGVYDADLGTAMVNEATLGQRVTISGIVYDGAGQPLRDALLEVWQADAAGRYPGRDPGGAADPNFTGWGRAAGDYATGLWSFDTIKPGRVPFPDGRMQEPHVTFWIVARGINLGLQTRMYFSDENNAADPVLDMIGDPARAATLIAARSGEGTYRFDIRLQGDQETVFFDF
ncbi:MAG: protocatechuate 3,4-dioxygenase subunit alpha [Pseudomonadota bacterium]